MLPDKIEDVANGEMERTVLLPLIAEMFGEDDLLRINLEKDDMIMMMIVVHNLTSIVFSLQLSTYVTFYGCNCRPF